MVGSAIAHYILCHHRSVGIRASYLRTEPFIKNPRIEYVRVDLRSQDECRRAVRGCDYAILAAASSAGAVGLTSRPWEQVNDNLIMNASLLEACSVERVKRIVYVGSATLYQHHPEKIRESDLDLNRDPHPSQMGVGWVARYIEKLCLFWHQTCGIEIVVVRAANVFGPYAKFDPQYSNFIPALIRKAAEKMEPFEVWGSPSVVRDVIYSGDFAQAVAMLLGRDSITFDTFNLGSGLGTSVAQILQWALRSCGHAPSQITYRADRPTTVDYRVLDCSKIRESLRGEPQCSVEEGINRTAKWWMENRGWWKK
jgi:nucleoside-diphosphate-sugar epimerase